MYFRPGLYGRDQLTTPRQDHDPPIDPGGETCPARLAIAAATIALAAGASAAPAAVPGPREPIEHLGLSGANFHTRSGTPGCFSGGGSVGAGFPVPRGAMVTGATLYVIDSSPTVKVFGELSVHDFTTGATHTLGTAGSTVNGTSTMEIVVDPGYVLTTGQAVNLVVTIGSGTCFKGAEVHFIRNPMTTTTSSASRSGEPTPAPALAPDATLDS